MLLPELSHSASPCRDEKKNRFGHVVHINGICLAVCTLMCLMVSCSINLPIISNYAQGETLAPTVPHGVYEDVAWLTNSRIVFMYEPEHSIHAWDRELYLFDLVSNEWSRLSVPRPAECNASAWYGLPQRLPNGELGFSYTCNFTYSRWRNTLNAWNMQQNAFRVLQSYPDNFVDGESSYAPDMSELIQESAVNIDLGEKLYHVNRQGRKDQILPDYKRARSPSWSPDGHLIAFMGTKTLPQDSSIEKLVYYPWDLYLMDANGEAIRKLLSGVVSGDNVKWMPNKRYVSFRGEYYGLSGIWIMNPDSKTVTRIWNESAVYDWSPDGNRLIVIQCETQHCDQYSHPVILDTSKIN